MSDNIIFASQISDAHYCKCSKVERCQIFVHPSSEIQDALNRLMDLIKDYDEGSGSSSVIALQTVHKSGVFTSITKNTRSQTEINRNSSEVK